jgi:hypothetical protein
MIEARHSAQGKPTITSAASWRGLICAAVPMWLAPKPMPAGAQGVDVAE